MHPIRRWTRRKTAYSWFMLARMIPTQTAAATEAAAERMSATAKLFVCVDHQYGGDPVPVDRPGRSTRRRRDRHGVETLVVAWDGRSNDVVGADAACRHCTPSTLVSHGLDASQWCEDSNLLVWLRHRGGEHEAVTAAQCIIGAGVPAPGDWTALTRCRVRLSDWAALIEGWAKSRPPVCPSTSRMSCPGHMAVRKVLR